MISLKKKIYHLNHPYSSIVNLISNIIISINTVNTVPEWKLNISAIYISAVPITIYLIFLFNNPSYISFTSSNYIEENESVIGIMKS